MKWMKPYPCILQLPDLLGVKKQKRDVDKRKENEVSLQMTMTAKKDEELEYPSSLFKPDSKNKGKSPKNTKQQVQKGDKKEDEEDEMYAELI